MHYGTILWQYPDVKHNETLKVLHALTDMPSPNNKKLDSYPPG